MLIFNLTFSHEFGSYTVSVNHIYFVFLFFIININGLFILIITGLLILCDAILILEIDTAVAFTSLS